MSSSDDRDSPPTPVGDSTPIRDDAALATADVPGADDGIDDWLGCESCHPLTWLPAASDRRL